MYKSMREIGRQFGSYHSIGLIVDTPKDSAIKNAIFTDENGNPRNDLGVFQSEETAPEVREYVARMHRERPETENIPEKMRNDDAIIDAMPNHGESLMQYEDRVKSMVDDEKAKRKSARNEKKLKDAFKSLGLST